MSYATSRKSSRQATGIATVVVLHAGIIYALATGLGHQVVEIIKSPLETRIIDEVKKQPDTPPPPPKVAPPPPPFVPIPDFHVSSPAPTNAITSVTTVKPPEPVVIAAPPPPVVAPAVHKAPTAEPARPCAKPEYPPISKRLEESGVVALAFLVDVDGSVVESKVETSSGFPRLDEAARTALQRCQYRPGNVDGTPEKAWAHINFRWTLE